MNIEKAHMKTQIQNNILAREIYKNIKYAINQGKYNTSVFFNPGEYYDTGYIDENDFLNAINIFKYLGFIVTHFYNKYDTSEIKISWRNK